MDNLWTFMLKIKFHEYYCLPVRILREIRVLVYL